MQTYQLSDISNLCDCDSATCLNENNYFSQYESILSDISDAEKIKAVHNFLVKSQNRCERVGVIRAFKYALKKNDQLLFSNIEISKKMFNRINNDYDILDYVDIASFAKKMSLKIA